MSEDLREHVRGSVLFFGGWLTMNLAMALAIAQDGGLGLILLLLGVAPSLIALVLGAFVYGADGVRAAFQVGGIIERTTALLAVPMMVALTALAAAAALEAARQASVAGAF